MLANARFLCTKCDVSRLIDGYFRRGIDVDLLTRKMLMDAIRRPEKYHNLVIRVDGTCHEFLKLPRDQQLDIVMRAK